MCMETSFAILSSEIKSVYTDLVEDFSNFNESVRRPLGLLQKVIDEGDGKLTSFTDEEKSVILGFFRG